MGDRFVGSLCSSSPRRVLLMPVRAASLRCGMSFRSIMHRMSGTKSRRIVSSSGSSTNYDPAVAREDISPRTSPLGDKANTENPALPAWLEQEGETYYSAENAI